MFGSGTRPLDLANKTTSIISNEKINDNMKIAGSLEEYGLLIKGFNKTIKNEAKEQKRGFLSMLLGILGASLSGNLLTGKGTIRVDEETVGAGKEFCCHLILSKILKYKSITKTKLNLLVFIQDVIYLK